MMLALWNTEIFLRPRSLAYRNANSAMRRLANSVATFKLVTTPGVISFSMPAYKPSVFSRTTTRSTFSKRVVTPAKLRMGRTAPYKPSVLRNATFTLEKPVPTGVVHGPFKATRCSRMAASVDSGKVLLEPPCTAASPASWRSHWMSTLAAAKMRHTAAETSGPIPSPGIRTA